MEYLLDYRSNHLDKIGKIMTQAHQLQQDINYEVQYQGKQLEVIEADVDEANENLEGAKDELLVHNENKKG